MQIDKLLSFLYSSLSQSCPFPTPILSLLHETFPVAGELGPAQFTSGNAAPEKADPYESQQFLSYGITLDISVKFNPKAII